MRSQARARAQLALVCAIWVHTGPMWNYQGQRRPPFAVKPRPGQESVWDYPRPPRLVASAKQVVVGPDDLVVADTCRALRLLETGSPPTYYLPAEDVNWGALEPVSHSSVCEWKGKASYWRLKQEAGGPPVAWRYLNPSEPYEVLKDYAAFYCGRIPCFVDSHPVVPQAGSFYGGWVTEEIVGPWKGEPGTGHW